jgi:putative transposase
MPSKPLRYQNQRCLHFITFSCYRRTRLLDSTDGRDLFERELERVRCWHGCYITAYVVIPEGPPFAKSGRKGGATCQDPLIGRGPP